MSIGDPTLVRDEARHLLTESLTHALNEVEKQADAISQESNARILSQKKLATPVDGSSAPMQQSGDDPGLFSNDPKVRLKAAEAQLKKSGRTGF